MLNAQIKQKTEFVGRSIVLDMHSRSGFSGSPVFVYRTPGSGFAEAGQHFTGSMVYILGIHWGQFPEIWELLEGTKTSEMASRKDLVTKSEYIEGLSGMTCVVPSQAISDLLTTNVELQAMREADELRLAERIREGLAASPSPETSMTAPIYGAPNASPEEKQHYNSLLNQAAWSAKIKGPYE